MITTGSPARGGVLLPPRYYARVVAELGEQFRDNSGADGAKNREHPGAQELMWGLGDYPVTPEAHMRLVRRQCHEKSLLCKQEWYLTIFQEEPQPLPGIARIQG